MTRREAWGVYDARGLLLTLKDHDPELDHEDLKAHRRDMGMSVVKFAETGALVSKRGIPLILVDGPIASCTLTAELYVKWYDLYLVNAGAALAFDFSELEPYAPAGQSAYVDHAPNPRAIEACAEALGYTVDPVFLEVAYGRWFLEVSP